MISFLGGTACSSAPKQPDPMEFNRQAEAATDPAKLGRLEPGSEAERRAVERFHDFFAVFSPDNIRKKIRDVYAQDVWFNDTLKSVRGVEALEAYMVSSAEATESCAVEHVDTVAKDGEYYFRWRMDIRFKKFRKGEVQSSIGMSHVRFDKDGKVAFHQDYWDSGTHFFEKVPALGGAMRWIRRRL